MELNEFKIRHDGHTPGPPALHILHFIYETIGREKSAGGVI